MAKLLDQELLPNVSLKSYLPFHVPAPVVVTWVPALFKAQSVTTEIIGTTLAAVAPADPDVADTPE